MNVVTKPQAVPATATPTAAPPAQSTPTPSTLAPATFGELVEFAEIAARSQFVPKDYRNHPEDILLAVQLGSEVGLRPMQSLQNIAVSMAAPPSGATRCPVCARPARSTKTSWKALNARMTPTFLSRSVTC